MKRLVHRKKVWFFCFLHAYVEKAGVFPSRDSTVTVGTLFRRNVPIVILVRRYLRTYLL